MDDVLKITARIQAIIPVHWHLHKSKCLFLMCCKSVFCHCTPVQESSSVFIEVTVTKVKRILILRLNENSSLCRLCIYNVLYF